MRTCGRARRAKLLGPQLHRDCPERDTQSRDQTRTRRHSQWRRPPGGQNRTSQELQTSSTRWRREKHVAAALALPHKVSERAVPNACRGSNRYIGNRRPRYSSDNRQTRLTGRALGSVARLWQSFWPGGAQATATARAGEASQVLRDSPLAIDPWISGALWSAPVQTNFTRGRPPLHPWALP